MKKINTSTGDRRISEPSTVAAAEFLPPKSWPGTSDPMIVERNLPRPQQLTQKSGSKWSNGAYPYIHQNLNGTLPTHPWVSCDRAIRYSGWGVRSVGPVGDFLGYKERSHISPWERWKIWKTQKCRLGGGYVSHHQCAFLRANCHMETYIGNMCFQIWYDMIWYGMILIWYDAILYLYYVCVVHVHQCQRFLMQVPPAYFSRITHAQSSLLQSQFSFFHATTEFVTADWILTKTLPMRPNHFVRSCSSDISSGSHE